MRKRYRIQCDRDCLVLEKDLESAGAVFFLFVFMLYSQTLVGELQ